MIQNIAVCIALFMSMGLAGIVAVMIGDIKAETRRRDDQGTEVRATLEPKEDN